MDKYLPFAWVLSIIVTIVAWLTGIEFMEDVQLKLTESRDYKLVNYASDAAVSKAIDESKDLGLDYADYDYANIDPQVALDMFVTIYCKGRDWACLDGNYNLIKSDYLKSFMVCTYDGYYLAENVKAANGTTEFVFKPKQPYTMEYGHTQNSDIPEGQSYYLALNLNHKKTKYMLLTGTALNIGSITDITKGDTSKHLKAGDFTPEKQSVVINSVVSEAFMKSVFTQKEGIANNMIYVPSELTSMSRTNPVDGVTVLAYVNSNPWGTDAEKAIDVFGVSGTKVTHEDFVGCYIRDGVKYYSFTNNLPNGITRDDFIETFETALKAAQAGYQFDYSVLEN